MSDEVQITAGLEPVSARNSAALLAERDLKIKDLTAELTISRLMIETDAPYLTPRTIT